MHNKKVELKKLSREDLIAMLNEIREDDNRRKEIRDGNILSAAESLCESTGILTARRTFFHMSLDYALNPENGVDDDDVAVLFQIFEVLNVM